MSGDIEKKLEQAKIIQRNIGRRNRTIVELHLSKGKRSQKISQHNKHFMA